MKLINNSLAIFEILVWIKLGAAFRVKESGFLLAKSSKDITVSDIGKDQVCQVPPFEDLGNDKDGVLAGIYLETGFLMCNFPFLNIDLLFPLQYCKLFKPQNRTWVPLRSTFKAESESRYVVTTERLFDAVFCTPDQRNVYMMFVFEPQEASKDNFGFLLVFEIKDSTSSYPIKFIPHPIDRGETFLSTYNARTQDCFFMPTASYLVANCMIQAADPFNIPSFVFTVEPLHGFKLLKLVGDEAGQVYYTMKEQDPIDSSSPRYGCGQFSDKSLMTNEVPGRNPTFYSNYNYIQFHDFIGIIKSGKDSKSKVKLLLADNMETFNIDCNPRGIQEFATLNFYDSDLASAKVFAVVPQSFTKSIECNPVTPDQVSTTPSAAAVFTLSKAMFLLSFSLSMEH